MSLAASLLWLLSCSSTALGYTVLTVITPGPQSHLFGMRKITEEMHSRGINVVVSPVWHSLQTRRCMAWACS